MLSQLPKKKEFVEKIGLSFEQQELYDDLRTQFSKRIEERKELLNNVKDSNNTNGKTKAPEGTQGQGGSSMLMDLRKAANHRLLHRRVYDNDKLRQMAKLMKRVMLLLFV